MRASPLQLARNAHALPLSFLLNMTAFPEMIRNVALVGHLHHGKTALMDMLVFETHKLIWDADKPVRTILFSGTKLLTSCNL